MKFSFFLISELLIWLATIVLATESVYYLEHNAYNVVPQLSRQGGNKCVPVDIKECKKWYDMRRPSNIYTSTTVEYKRVHSLIAQLAHLPSKFKHCVRDATFLLCAIYSPVCIKGNYILQPCRGLCVNWKNTCGNLKIFKNVALPSELKDCSELPEYDNSMCIQPNTFFTKKQEKQNNKIKENKKACDCQGFHQNTPKYRNFRKSTYVLEASITSKVTLASGNTKIMMHVTRVYKEGKIKVKIGKLRMWSSCLCHKDIDYGNKYFILAEEPTAQSKKKKKLEIRNTTLILPYKDYVAKIKKWQTKCLRKNPTSCSSNESKLT